MGDSPTAGIGTPSTPELRDAVVAAAVELVTARPLGARWTRENCRAVYDAGVVLDAAVRALLGRGG